MKIFTKTIFICLFFFIHTMQPCLVSNNSIGQESGQQSLEIISAQGVVSKRFEHDTHYQIIKKFLAQYKRAFTMLDIDAGQGYYSFKTAYDFPSAVCVMTGANSPAFPDAGDQLFSLCADQNLNNIILLNKTFTPDELQHLNECEHFDVVLVMNELYHVENWKERLDSILNMGDNIIIKLPADSSIEEYVISHGGVPLDSSRQSSRMHTSLYLIASHKKILRRKTWLLPKMQADNYIIESSFTEKKLVKAAYWPPNSHQTTNWIPGINLLTFKMCTGVFPSPETIKNSLLKLKTHPHTDWMINNMIIQGTQVAWIDMCDSSRQNGAPIKPDVFSEQKFQAHLALLSLNNPQQIEHYFWFTLIRKPIAHKNLVRFWKPFLPISSTIFDIQPDNEQLISTYLGHGARVMCFDVLDIPHSSLEKKFEHDVIFVSNEIMRNTIGKATLDNMIALYGKPQACNIHLNENDTYELLQSLSEPVPYLIFKFNHQFLSTLEQSLLYLASIGYTQFNFSIRDIPVLGLNTNGHIGSQEQWVTAHKLLLEIDRFSKLDYDIESLCGYIYARA